MALPFLGSHQGDTMILKSLLGRITRQDSKSTRRRQFNPSCHTRSTQAEILEERLLLAADLSVVPFWNGEGSFPAADSATHNLLGGATDVNGNVAVSHESGTVLNGSGAIKAALAIPAGQTGVFGPQLAGNGPSASYVNTRDLTIYERLDFQLKNETGASLSISLRLKDHRELSGQGNSHRASRSITVPSNGNWQAFQIPLSLSSGWTVTGYPDLTRAREIEFVITASGSAINGNLFVDDMNLIEPGGSRQVSSVSDAVLLDTLAERSFRNLWGSRDQVIQSSGFATGFVSSTSTSGTEVSLRSTALLVRALPEAVSQGWITQSNADSYVEGLVDGLNTVIDSSQHVPPSTFDRVSFQPTGVRQESSVDAAYMFLSLTGFQSTLSLGGLLEGNIQALLNKFDFGGFSSGSGWRKTFNYDNGVRTGSFSSAVHSGYTQEIYVISLAAHLANSGHVEITTHFNSGLGQTTNLGLGNPSYLVNGSTALRSPQTQAVFSLFADVEGRGSTISGALNPHTNWLRYQADVIEWAANRIPLQPDIVDNGTGTTVVTASPWNNTPSDLTAPWSAGLALQADQTAAVAAIRKYAEDGLLGPFGPVDSARYSNAATAPSDFNGRYDLWNSGLFLAAVMQDQFADTDLLTNSPEVTIALFDVFAPPTDYGDAPLPYPTTNTENGARHLALRASLGSSRDADDDGDHSPTASSDNGDDGVVLGQVIVGAQGVERVVTASGSGKLDAWIDFDGDGNWGGPGEQIFDSVSLRSGGNVLSFDVPSWAVPGQTFARFRISQSGDLGVTGAAADGEVEDYLVTISPAGQTDPTQPYGLARTISSTIGGPSDIFPADIDGDGDVDVAFASDQDGTIGWLENNNNDGTFSNHVIFTSDLGFGPQGVTVADLDGDGDLDILSASHDARIRWHENNGSQQFTERTIVPNASGAEDVVVADADGDGDLDIFAALSLNGQIILYENNGSQGFTQRIIDNDASDARSVTVADLDGDGDLDVAGASAGSNSISWYENNGQKQYTKREIPFPTTQQPRDVITTDIDGDGDIDLVTASFNGGAGSFNGQITVWKNNGAADPTFTATTIDTPPQASSVFAGDLDGDGDIDVVGGSGSLKWYENDGAANPSFTTNSLGAVSRPTVFAANLDGDADLDLLAASFGTDSITWHAANGAANITADIIDVTPDPRETPVGTITISFSETVENVDIADFSLTRNGQAISLSGISVIGSGASRSIDLSTVTSAEGTYTLSLNAQGSNIQNSAGTRLLDDSSESWVLAARVLTADIVDVAPDPRNNAVGEVDINFTDIVTGLDIGDITLTRDGVNVDISTIGIGGSGSSYTIDLTTVTAPFGNYVLTLNATGSGITDSVNTPLVQNATDDWTSTVRQDTTITLAGRGRTDDYIDITSSLPDLSLVLRADGDTLISRTFDGNTRVSLAGYPQGDYVLSVDANPNNYTVTPRLTGLLGDPNDAAIDLDGNGQFSFANDGILLLAYSLGTTGAGLEAFRGAGNSRSGVEIEAEIEKLADSLDLDGNGTFTFANDGILLLAHSLGTTGSGLEPFRGSNPLRSGADIALRISELLTLDDPGAQRVQTQVQPDAESSGSVQFIWSETEPNQIDAADESQNTASVSGSLIVSEVDSELSFDAGEDDQSIEFHAVASTEDSGSSGDLDSYFAESALSLALGN